jgi:hypothetical protein
MGSAESRPIMDPEAPKRTHLLDIFDMDDVYDTYIPSDLPSELSEIDTLSFAPKKRHLLSLLATDLPNKDKMLIHHFFCTKMFGTVHMDDALKETITASIVKLGLSNELPIIRIRFLKYLNSEISLDAATRLYRANVIETLPQIFYFQILKHLLKNTVDGGLKEEIVAYFEDTFHHSTLFVKMDIADIFILNDLANRGNQMLDTIRALEGIDKPHTVYTDSQNVHTSSINTSVNVAAAALVEDMDISDTNALDILETLRGITPASNVVDVEEAIERILIDETKFSHNGLVFDLESVFYALWRFIHTLEHIAELRLRLVEELVEMNKYCSTGHLSRLINVIQGFTDRYAIRISDLEQITAALNIRLVAIAEKAPDSVLDAMTDEHDPTFAAYLADRIPLSSILKEYGDTPDIRDIIIAKVRHFSNYKNIDIEDESPSFRIL